ncbi:ubiquitin-like protein Pup [Bifidobacterium aerophilum]|uniref:Prokaryotic ubiquitin-like protein Pup n=1 Tax=Bifidobacterium aerophilum TaxID=1798155 RepID=A0A6N9Z1S1_9BIFI|nr:ubiquitin-like protein Pup [Bifidobacterium aerophilum]NEG88577.1 ubiquitin-like protein Pup [Bifidobacterium aerophilum]
MPQEFDQAQAAHSAGEQVEQETTRVKATEAEASGDVLDSVLDDIESVLETNAEEYVNSFVQKGGE